MSHIELCTRCGRSMFATVNNLRDLLSSEGFAIKCHCHSSRSVHVRVTAVLDHSVDVARHETPTDYPLEILKIKSLFVHGSDGCREVTVSVPEGR
jgi:hypothetical protein